MVSTPRARSPSVPNTCGSTCPGVRSVYCPKGAVGGEAGQQLTRCSANNLPAGHPGDHTSQAPPRGAATQPGLAHQPFPTRVSLHPQLDGEEAAWPEAWSLAAHPNHLGSFHPLTPRPPPRPTEAGSLRGAQPWGWLEFQVRPVPRQQHPLGTLQRHMRASPCSPWMSLGCGTELLQPPRHLPGG